jgi:WXG100 family type VII secretion target
MAEQIRMNFEAMDGMINACGQAHQGLAEIMEATNKIAEDLADGGLVGAAGDALVTACRKDLGGSLNMLIEKFEEIQGDLRVAKEAMQAADTTARGYYQ